MGAAARLRRGAGPPPPPPPWPLLWTGCRGRCAGRHRARSQRRALCLPVPQVPPTRDAPSAQRHLPPLLPLPPQNGEVGRRLLACDAVGRWWRAGPPVSAAQVRDQRVLLGPLTEVLNMAGPREYRLQQARELSHLSFSALLASVQQADFLLHLGHLQELLEGLQMLEEEQQQQQQGSSSSSSSGGGRSSGGGGSSSGGGGSSSTCSVRAPAGTKAVAGSQRWHPDWNNSALCAALMLASQRVSKGAGLLAPWAHLAVRCIPQSPFSLH